MTTTKILPTTFEEVLIQLGKQDSFRLPYPQAETKFERYLNACAKIPLISEALNEGKVFDFTNGESKWYLWFERKAGGWGLDYADDRYDRSSVGAGFHFINEKTALYAGKTFLDIFIDYLPE